MKIDRSLAGVLQKLTAALALVCMLSSSAAAQSRTNPTELNVAVGVGPPFVIQQNGSLTGFSIDLWNEVAARIKCETNYETMPDAASILEAMLAKRIEVVAVPVIITAARDEEFDFSLPIMQVGMQIMVRGTEETAASNPLEALLYFAVLENGPVVARHRAVARSGPGAFSLAVRVRPRGRHHQKPELHSRHLRGDLLGCLVSGNTGGNHAASLARADIFHLLDVCRGGLRSVLYRATDHDLNGPADSRID